MTHSSCHRPTERWTHNLPESFLQLCETYEIASAPQARVLALALRDSHTPLRHAPRFSSYELDQIIGYLTPARKENTDTQIANTPNFIPGALVPLTANHLPGLGQQTVENLEPDPDTRRAKGPDEDKEAPDA